MTLIIIDFDSFWADNPKLKPGRDDRLSIQESDFILRRKAALTDFWKSHRNAISRLDARLDPVLLHDVPAEPDYDTV